MTIQRTLNAIPPTATSHNDVRRARFVALRNPTVVPPAGLHLWEAEAVCRLYRRVRFEGGERPGVGRGKPLSFMEVTESDRSWARSKGRPGDMAAAVDKDARAEEKREIARCKLKRV